MVGASAGSTLALALAVVMGAIPGHGQLTGPSAAAAAAFDDPAPLADTGAPEAPGEVVAGPADEAPASPGPQPDAESVGSPDPAPAPEAEQSPPPPAPAPVQASPAAPAPPPPPPPPTADPVVPRRHPSPAEVQRALDGLDPYVDSVFSPTAAQVAEAGDKVCTAFDEGQTFAQVKATARDLVSQVPLTTVRPGADDYVVRTVVALYCPGHQPKLV